ncbi:hypothetical protein RhiirA1_460879 [Rhizophagus irregularis]|uniref:Uncharacterized protein n=1 Tax=Rhizophagus irregularis TaxID=588596 RepID=A0A2N0RQJ5_9GLOM|nr:hypothetical protein RhiirA1_460879 [Rhizophagus irregularis]
MAFKPFFNALSKLAEQSIYSISFIIELSDIEEYNAKDFADVAEIVNKDKKQEQKDTEKYSDEDFIYTEHEENNDVQNSSENNSDIDENTNELDENNSTSDNATSDNATIEEEKVGDFYKKTSGIWQHYDIIEQNSKCKYCI